MTAIHLLKTPTAAIMASDTAMMGDDGRVHTFAPKHAYFEDARLAFGLSGRGYLAALAEEIDKFWPGEGTPEQLLSIIPKAARVLRDRFRAEHPHREGHIWNGIGSNDFAVFVALVDDGGPRLLAMSTCPRPDIGPGEAYEWMEIDGFIQPSVDQAKVLPKGYWRGVRDCRTLFEAQRNEPFPLYRGAKGIGGEAFVTIITRSGVSHKRICRWDDVVGEPIRASVA